jgi:anti-sigma regulatory factor (Ser/Thr protein kinase)/serine/threonine protein phosphatase PrpC
VGPLLAPGWLAGAEEEIPVLDEASVSLVRAAVRRRGAAQGLEPEALEALVTAASELAHNQRKHARLGVIGVRAVARAGVAGLEVIAADSGAGIADPAAALRDAPRLAGSGLGVGLASAYRLADELDFDVRRGEGTCVRARKFSAALPRREVAVLSRPCAGESRSGDHAAFVCDGDTLVFSVVDGLGHGPLARVAADAAIDTLRARALDPPAEILARCDQTLETTRGAVMSVVRFDATTRTLEHAGAGNVATRLYLKGVGHTFMSTARVLGARHQPVRLATETLILAGEAILLMFSDGLTTRTDLGGRLDLLRQPPIFIAQDLLDRFGRADDDALVLVARLG